MTIGVQMAEDYWLGKLKAASLALGCIIFAATGVNAAAISGTYDNAPGEVENTIGNMSPRTLGIKLPPLPVQIAQTSDVDVRVIQLEENLRRLNGQLEELNFQLLQMQELFRRMQEDNEYRFQELEDGKQGALSSPKSKIAGSQNKQKEILPEKSQPSNSADANGALGGSQKIANTTKKKRMIDGVEIFDGTGDETSGSGIEMPLGTITFDSLGNVIDSALGKPLDLTVLRSDQGEGNGSISDDNFAAIGSAKELYELGYEYIQAGDYLNSEKAFAAFVERYPQNAKIPNAQYWLGESMFSQANFDGAAKVFLDAHTNFPEARIAPQMLLKLGISLVGMRQRELACATYAKVLRKYPNMSNTLRKRVADEQNSARCLNG